MIIPHSPQRVVLDLPPGHPSHLSAYTVTDADGAVHLVDAGWPSAVNLERWEEHLGQAMTRSGGIASVVVTHHHADHLGLASRIRDLTGAQIVLHRVEQAIIDDVSGPEHGAPTDEYLHLLGVPPSTRPSIVAALASRDRHQPVRADLLVEDGDLLPIPGKRMRVVHTPGHTAGHICIADEDERWLFTGDHILPEIYPGIALGGDLGPNPLGTYFESLGKIKAFDGYLGLPGHGAPFADLTERADHIAGRFEARAAQVERIVQSKPLATPWQVAQGVTWSRGWRSLKGEPLFNALVQTAAHMAFLQHASRV